jgi:[ribosomal protein S18]-alanine N-acetyltransferase
MEKEASIVIRQMTLADIDQVLEIDQLSFALPWPRSSFRYELNENRASRHWVAELHQGGKIIVVGMIVCWLIVDEIHIGTLAVHPDFRRLQIGEKLLKWALIESRNEAEVAFLEVRRSNEPAISLYLKFGFIENGVRKKYYSDNHEDAILMELRDLTSIED